MYIIITHYLYIYTYWYPNLYIHFIFYILKICSSKFSPDDKLKFLLRCRPHGFKPNGLSHSYTATATAVIFNDVKIAIQSSGENGNKNANNGISDLVFGDANKETPL